MFAVGTPSGEDGSADLSHVLAVADELGERLDHACLVVDKSTVPVGTAERVAQRINAGLVRREQRARVIVASNPEFLKEGSAVEDFMRPDRVIVGCDDERGRELLRRLYAPFLRNHDRLLCMGVRAAEFSKYTGSPAPQSPDGFVPVDVELDHGTPDPNEVNVDDIPF